MSRLFIPPEWKTLFAPYSLNPGRAWRAALHPGISLKNIAGGSFYQETYLAAQVRLDTHLCSSFGQCKHLSYSLLWTQETPVQNSVSSSLRLLTIEMTSNDLMFPNCRHAGDAWTGLCPRPRFFVCVFNLPQSFQPRRVCGRAAEATEAA